MKSKYTIVFLHPYNTSIKDTKSFLGNHINNTNIKWIFVKAPLIKITQDNNTLHHAWFDYTTDYDGKTEDKININTLIIQRIRIINLIKKIIKTHNGNYNNVLLGGISQGGCMAIDISCFIKVRCVFTFVSHMLYLSKKRKLKHPWYSLIAKNDNTFRKEWTFNDTLITKQIIEVNDDHFLANTNTDEFIYNVFKEEHIL